MPAKGRKLNYDELEDRMKTFKLPPQWEGPLDYQSMAEAGFVYTGQEDLVFCFHCNIKLDRWSKDMEPLLRHKKDSPTYSFMRQRLQAIKGEIGKTKSVVAPSKPLNPRLTSSIGQLQSSSLTVSKAIHTVVTGLNEPRLSYGGSFNDCPGASLPITAENYQSEAERIKSFVGWPLNEAVHPEQLARVGFVYTGEGALVQCFQCGVKYRHWYKGDVPLSVHQKCNPRCTFLQSLGSNSKSSLEEQRPRRSYIQAEPISNNTEGEEVSKHSLQFPDYSDQAIRLQSFKHWGGVLPAQELAEGGFYMIARRDVVRCFSCNVVVQDWERSDNVIDEHHKHSPNCSFLKNIKSRGKMLSPPSSIDKTVQLSSVEKSVIKNENKSPQLSSTLEPLSTVNNQPPSINSRASSKSPDRSQDEQIAGIRYPPSWHRNPPLSPQGASRKLSESSDESFHSAESHRGNDYSILTSLDPPKTKIMYEESLSEGLENNISIKTSDSKRDDTGAPGMGLCQICYDKKIDCIFLPCGHARTCEGCATRIKNSGQPCPYCRKGVYIVFDDHPGASLPITAENYSSEAERIKSFVGWPLNEAVHPEQLARVGFVYTGEGALVQCFQCGVKYHHWYKGDVPLSVHQKCNPRCPFLQKLGNRSSASEQRSIRSYIQPASVGNNTEGEEVRKHSLQFPNYSDQAIRLQSFKHWGGVLPAQELAEGGFYMIARRDVVRCFSCNVVVQDWERSDNVIDEHHKSSLSQNNESFEMENESRKNKSETLDIHPLLPILPKSKFNSDNTSTCTVDPPKTKIMYEESSSEENNISIRISDTDGTTAPGMQQVNHLEASVYSPPDGQRNSYFKGAIAGQHYPSVAGWFSSLPGQSRETPTVDPEKSSEPNCDMSKYKENLSEELENSSIKTSDTKGDDTGAPEMGICQICYDKKIDCIFLPCGHARTCEGCATRIKNSGQPCPYCRKGVSATHRIYL